MPKYIFSQGKVIVESGVYVPPRDTKHGSHKAVVLIMVQPTQLATEILKSTQDKDEQNASEF